MADEHTGYAGLSRGIFELIELPLCAIAHLMKGSIQYCFNTVTESLLPNSALGKKNTMDSTSACEFRVHMCCYTTAFCFFFSLIYLQLGFFGGLFPT